MDTTPDPIPGKISAVINTYNASALLERTLQSLGAFDEIVVCDMESTDATVAIARSYGCKVVTFPKGNHNICEPARNAAIQAASSEWVLVVDADEVVTPQLAAYLYERIAAPDCPAALMVPRKNHFLGRHFPSSYPDYQCRFMRRTCVDWPPEIHSKPLIDGRVEHIPSKRVELALLHASESMSAFYLKMCRYTDNEVTRRQAKRVTLLRLVVEPLFRFVKRYFFKGEILHGKVGYIRSQNSCFYRFMVLCKLYERQQRQRNDLY